MADLPKPQSDRALLSALAAFDTCEVANAIERFAVRLRNEGFTNDSVHCRFPRLPAIAGYAVTLRVHSSNPPVSGAVYPERADWWDLIEATPGPSILVIQDSDRRPGVGTFIGGVHAAILTALGCVGVLTNGAVRDLRTVERSGLQLFSAGVAVSHAYMHVVEANRPVEVAGLKITPGDLLHGDEHGVVQLPRPIAAELPRVLAEEREREREIFEFCQSSTFSKDGLKALLARAH